MMTKKLRYFCTLLLMAVASVAWAGDVTDVLTPSVIGISGSSYTTWSGVTATSDAVYAGQSSAGTGIQLRSSGNNSGVVTTTSGGKVKSITVEWHNNTQNGRTLNVYGKNSAYTQATDLYGNNAGDLLGTIVCGTSTTIEVEGDYEYIGLRSAGSAMYLNSITIVWDDGASGDAPSISADNVDIAYNATQGEIAYTLANEVTGGSVSASTTSSWLTLGTDFASPIAFTCEANDGGAERTATVTLTYTYGNDNVTKNVTVTQAGDSNRPGTENNPYTVAQAIAAIDANTDITGVYATGIVSEIVTEFNSQYGNITYNISVDGTTTADQLQAYRGKSYNGANFTSANDIKVGDEVVIYGNLKKHTNGVYEFDQNNQLVSLNRTAPTVTVAQTAVNVDAAGGDGTINVTYENFSQNTDISVQIQDATGAPTTFSWFDADIDNNNNVYYLVDPNTDTAERTAYLRVMVADKDAKEVCYSDVITITQEAYVAPSYAVLPFEFNSGKSAIENTEGLTQEGLGTDYSASNAPNTQLKFDSTGDWLLLQFDEEPGKLSFDIKGNGYSATTTSTFTVQTSEDGATFTDLASYTELGDAATKEYNLDANVRYVKWIYTTKGSGNVGLGNIKLKKPAVTITIKQDFTATTFSCDKALDFTGQNIQAYIITDENGTTEQVTVVAPNEGLYIEGAAGSYDIPIYDGLNPNPMLANKLEATDGTTTLYSSNTEVYYAFGKQNGKEAFFKVPTTGYTPSANKAVLKVPAALFSGGAKEMIVIGGGEATGIDSIDNEQLNGENYYTVDGKLVKGQPTQKGLYIVNGRKVVVK